MADQPLSYWIAVARMSFEDDFHRLFNELGISRKELAERLGATPAYVSKILNARNGNFQLETLAKLARSIEAILQIRLIKEEGEVVRIVDYETAGKLDDLSSASLEATPAPKGAKVLNFPSNEPSGAYRRLNAVSSSASGNA